jgi:hypothetical protein
MDISFYKNINKICSFLSINNAILLLQISTSFLKNRQYYIDKLWETKSDDINIYMFKRTMISINTCVFSGQYDENIIKSIIVTDNFPQRILLYSLKYKYIALMNVIYLYSNENQFLLNTTYNLIIPRSNGTTNNANMHSIKICNNDEIYIICTWMQNNENLHKYIPIELLINYNKENTNLMNYLSNIIIPSIFNTTIHTKWTIYTNMIKSLSK